MSLLVVEGLGITFGGLHAVQDVSFSLKPGEIVSVIGPNGAGKTTLFNVISGVYLPHSGTVMDWKICKFWKVRDRPRRAKAKDAMPVTSSPFSLTVPEWGR